MTAHTRTKAVRGLLLSGLATLAFASAAAGESGKGQVSWWIQHHGVVMEIHAVEFPETGAVVPMVLCLPSGEDKRPGVCVFSGHSQHGLRDLVLDLDSYQRGVAVRLARAGFVTIAVEKIDTGYLSRDGRSGVDAQVTKPTADEPQAERVNR